MRSKDSTQELITLAEVYSELKQKLNSEEANLEARIILETVLRIDASDLIVKPETMVTRVDLKKIYEICEKRNQRIPLAYILEEAHFMDLRLFVNDDVLVPRPETELLVEKVLEEIKNRKIHHPVILDLCTGSGCIAIALKKALPAAKVYASDISKAALNVASINAQRYNAEINFVWGDYLDPFIEALKPASKSPYTQKIQLPIMRNDPPYFDVIVSNPPYVSEEDYQKLEPELHYEPKHALVGFPYEAIKQQMEDHNLLKPNGFMAFEFGAGQSEQILSIFPQARLYKDYAGIERMLFSS